jgi:hypothetical protein
MTAFLHKTPAAFTFVSTGHPAAKLPIILLLIFIHCSPEEMTLDASLTLGSEPITEHVSELEKRAKHRPPVMRRWKGR